MHRPHKPSQLLQKHTPRTSLSRASSSLVYLAQVQFHSLALVFLTTSSWCASQSGPDPAISRACPCDTDRMRTSHPVSAPSHAHLSKCHVFEALHHACHHAASNRSRLKHQHRPERIVPHAVDGAPVQIVAGDYIDASLGTAFCLSTMASAGFGNLISDIAGTPSPALPWCSAPGARPPALTQLVRRLSGGCRCWLCFNMSCTLALLLCLWTWLCPLAYSPRLLRQPLLQPATMLLHSTTSCCSCS